MTHPYSIEDKFFACVDIIHAMPKTGPVPRTYVEMLTMYGLFKQATIGPCNVPQPSFWNLVEKYKWDAWNGLADMSKEEAMERYVNGVLEKIDYCAENWNWDEMMAKYAKDYKQMEPILREKFRILDREYIKEDGSKVQPPPRSRNSSCVLSGTLLNNTPRQGLQVTQELPEGSRTPQDPLSDGEYCDARDDNDSVSRSSSFSLNHNSSTRIRTIRAHCARIDVELRCMSDTIKLLSESLESRHFQLLKLFKNTAVYIAVPSRLSWRAVFFFLIWPFIVHYLFRYFGHGVVPLY